MPPSERSGGSAEQAAAFASALRDLHAQAGRPSTRAMAGRLENVSHTTVAEALSGKRVPSWAALRGLINLLGGDEDHFLNLWLEATTKPDDASAAVSQTDAFLVRYRRLAAEYHGKLEPPDFDRRRRIPIDDLYVPLLITPVGNKDASNLDTGQLDDLIARTVLLGDPGGGKTTVCHALMYRHATNPELTVPFLVPLRDFAVHAASARSVAHYIESRLEAFYQCSSPPGAVEQLLDEGNALILFDGLDEVIDAGARSEVVSIIELFCAEFSRVRVLVTSRVVGYMQSQLAPDEFTAYLLRGYSQDQITHYARKWFRLSDDHALVEAEQYAAAFVSESAHMAGLSANPLLLAVMCVMYRSIGYIPRNEPELYERSADILLDRWDARRGINVGLHFRYLLKPTLRHLAFWIYAQEGSRSAVTQSELTEEISSFLAQRRYEDLDEAAAVAQEFVDFLRGRAWMFTSVGVTSDGQELYSFTFRAFLEYFAAAYLAASTDTPEELAQAILPHIARKEWEAVSKNALQIEDRNVERGAERAVVALLDAAEGGLPKEQLNLIQFLVDCINVLELPSRLRRRANAAADSLSPP
jgi:hypothetical protein